MKRVILIFLVFRFSSANLSPERTGKSDCSDTNRGPRGLAYFATGQMYSPSELAPLTVKLVSLSNVE